MKQCDHPNIIRPREVFFGSATVYVVMDLCEVGTVCIIIIIIIIITVTYYYTSFNDIIVVYRTYT
jgi:hypothetical protein